MVGILGMSKIEPWDKMSLKLASSTSVGTDRVHGVLGKKKKKKVDRSQKQMNWIARTSAINLPDMSFLQLWPLLEGSKAEGR